MGSLLAYAAPGTATLTSSQFSVHSILQQHTSFHRISGKSVTGAAHLKLPSRGISRVRDLRKVVEEEATEVNTGREELLKLLDNPQSRVKGAYTSVDCSVAGAPLRSHL